MAPIAIIGGAPRHLGAWRPSRLRLRAPRPAVDLAALPMKVDIVVNTAGKPFPTDYDQGQLGSCGPNSVAEVFEHDLGAKFSRLFLYWYTRALEGDVDEDGGVEIPDLMTVAHAMGMPLESEWDYQIDAFRTPPPEQVVADAFKHRVERFEPVADLDHLLVELGEMQRPVTFGFQVPASMEDGAGETARTGVVNLPSATDPAIGGHCVNAIGFDRARQLVRCTSHYGATFGDRGTLWLPFSFFTTGAAMDLTAIKSVS